MSLEIGMLILATALTFIIFFTNSVNFVLAFALIGIYIFYLWASSARESEEPELVGAAALIGSLPNTHRRIAVVVLFIYSAGIILIAAEPFVEALIETGGDLGIDEFILIQWVALSGDQHEYQAENLVTEDEGNGVNDSSGTEQGA